MSGNVIPRRSFLVGSAGALCLGAGAGCLGLDIRQQAHAEEAEVASEKTGTVHSICAACSNNCGFTAYVVDGKLGKLIGDADHPAAAGKLCARGYGYTQIAYSPDRLTEPLKRNDRGGFERIDWDRAYSEIAERLSGILEENGPGAIAAVYEPTPTASFYMRQFMYALGSANIYADGDGRNASRASGYVQVIGTDSFEADIENSKMTMFIGRTDMDTGRPGAVGAMQKAHENGSHVVFVDPRCSNSIVFADEWIPVNPGTELAFVLAMSQVLVEQGLYDKNYVAQNAIGFEEWAEKIGAYTPAWAEKKTGVSAKTIERLARDLASAAPAASVAISERGGFGSSYANSGETARAVCAFNTLLGNWNQPGGALIEEGIEAYRLDPRAFPVAPTPSAMPLGSDEYPLGTSSLYAASMAKTGAVKAMFIYATNIAAEYSNTAYIKDALESLELSVVIDVQMTETAELADYVLPDVSYLERMELPFFLSGKVPAVALGNKVLEVIHPDTRAVDRIISELGEACNVGRYFDFSIEELADAQLQTLGLSLGALKQSGIAYFDDRSIRYGEAPRWRTASGRIELSSQAMARAGYSAVPGWVEPEVMPYGAEFRLIGGEQEVHTRTRTANVDALMDITEDYDLTRVWMNPGAAEKLGIVDGDEVEVTNSEHTGRCRVKVTPLINPNALFMPSHYGGTAEGLHTAFGIGLRQLDFVAFQLEPGYGSAMTGESIVMVKKVGA